MIKIYENVNSDTDIIKTLKDYGVENEDLEFAFNTLKQIIRLLLISHTVNSLEDIDLNYLINDCVGGIDNLLMLKEEPILFVDNKGIKHYYKNGTEISEKEYNQFCKDFPIADRKNIINKYKLI